MFAVNCPLIRGNYVLYCRTYSLNVRPRILDTLERVGHYFQKCASLSIGDTMNEFCVLIVISDASASPGPG